MSLHQVSLLSGGIGVDGKKRSWIALQGVHLPLAFTGQEAIWQKVFMVTFHMILYKIGDKVKAVLSVDFAVTTHTDWWGDPLSQNLLDQQVTCSNRYCPGGQLFSSLEFLIIQFFHPSLGMFQKH
ncbi:alpha-N-acetylglucosaminidase-like [Syzygium oleosum]|uniref:alpha-N-acetylglucosaminidase-like n=1 Tax=Syzygium oleosum TaxID=219896 RepID=UPI0024B9D69F|nr:alpha-N-acetylglucosaminidase-like [Syzygium oleosum]